MLVSIICITLVGCGGSKNTIETKNGEKLKIVESETSSIEYEDFDNGLVKIKNL